MLGIDISFSSMVLQLVDLAGSRDFLTAEAAEAALAALLATGSIVSKVGCGERKRTRRGGLGGLREGRGRMAGLK